MLILPVRMSRAEECAALVRYIVESAYLTATTIRLDAGARMGTL